MKLITSKLNNELESDLNNELESDFAYSCLIKKKKLSVVLVLKISCKIIFLITEFDTKVSSKIEEIIFFYKTFMLKKYKKINVLIKLINE